MSITDKLTTVHDNVERVFAAGSTVGYKDGHAVGEQVGYDTGYAKGVESGLETGREEGYTSGYEAGFSEGKAQGGGGLSETDIEAYNNLLGELSDLTSYVYEYPTYLGNSLFFMRYDLIPRMSFPNVTGVGLSAFTDTNLERIILPKCKSLMGATFSTCMDLRIVDLYECEFIGDCVFQLDYNLYALIIRTNKVCELMDFESIEDTGVDGRGGYVYVPKHLVDSYKSATNWSRIPLEIRAIEDYPEICAIGLNNPEV